MDKIVDSLASYTLSLKYDALPAPVVQQVKRHLLDSLGVAVFSYPSEPSKIARRMAEGVTCRQSATIIGSGQQTTPDLAAFANGTMVQYPDFNDIYAGMTSGCHPSNNFSAVLACAEAFRTDGRSVITASVIAYEILCGLYDVVDWVDFDGTTFGILSAAAGAASILGLSEEKTQHCLSLAAASNIASRQMRRGTLSMWKECSFPNACRNAIWAARLASEGLTGPEHIFDGKSGLLKAVTGPFELPKFGGDGHDFRIMQAFLKRFSAGFYSQTAIDAALKIKLRLKSVEDIKEINVQTFDSGLDIMAGDPDKWHPKTRETADHSLPYVIAVAFKYGDPRPWHFTEEYLNDEGLLGVVQRVKVQTSEECNRDFPGSPTNIVEVVTQDGKRITEKVQHYRGHYKNPMSDKEVEEKFLSLTEETLTQVQTREILDMVWGMDGLKDVSELLAPTKI